MQIRANTNLKIITSIFVMSMLILLVFQGKVPNPNMILVTGVILCSALFGYVGGIISGLAMLFYTLYFFSTGHNFITFTGENLQKVIVTLIGVTADVLLVSKLKETEIVAFKEIQNLTEKLQEENKKLQEISTIDSLTGIKNRFALRNDYPDYDNADSDITVMMLDLDNFKLINDYSGHGDGDRIISETGRLLRENFGMENSYRYGGDEFLVVIPKISEQEFLGRVNNFLKVRPKHKVNGKFVETSYSIGYVHKNENENRDKALRELFAIADERMYQAKRSGKNKVVGNYA